MTLVWPVAFALTLAVELPIVGRRGAALEARSSQRFAVALAANSLTHPIVWFAFPALGLGWAPTTAASEVFAWLCEAALFRMGFGRCSWGAALRLSLLANAASFAVGLLLASAGWP